jgi:hypothetical protein
MPYEMTTTTTVYTLEELRDPFPRTFHAVVSRLCLENEEAWYELDLPNIVHNYQFDTKQQELEPLVDLERNLVRAQGRLQVPDEMRERWLEEFDMDVESVPVGEFSGWTGWCHFVGGEMYSWIPDEDGEALLALLRELMDNLRQELLSSYDVARHYQTVLDEAASEGHLFTQDGVFVGEKSDLF